MVAQANNGLGSWGWDRPEQPDGLGRIFREHKGGYAVLDQQLVERLAVVSGKLRRAIALGEAPKPVPGDWIVQEAQPSGRSIIHDVVPRKTWLRRRAPQLQLEQVLCANVDRLIVVMAVSQDFNVRRLERYLAIAKDGGVVPHILLTKADLAEDAESKRQAAEALGVPVVLSSQVSGIGLEAAEALLVPGQTHALLGSSGVGKSTFVNRWMAQSLQPVKEIRDDGKGRHTTTERTLFQLPSGALVMDTPGMRELGVTDSNENLEQSFEDIDALSAECRFSDCRHEREPECAVQAALSAGTLDVSRFNSYDKLRRERAGAISGRQARQRKR